MSKLRLISWNILNDEYSKVHKPQSERLEHIAKTIKSFNNDQPMVIFLCELSEESHLNHIAKIIGKDFKASKAVKYSSNEWMGFISNTKLQGQKVINHKKYDSKYAKLKSLQINLNGLQINGVHMPPLVLQDISHRVSIARSIINSVNHDKPSVIIGDLNCLPYQLPRLYLKSKGYKLSKGKHDDEFPSEYFKGKNIPKFVPKLAIDGHYFKGAESNKHWAIDTNFSDHPILVSDFSI